MADVARMLDRQNGVMARILAIAEAGSGLKSRLVQAAGGGVSVELRRAAEQKPLIVRPN